MIDENKVILKINKYIEELWNKDAGVGSNTIPIFIAGMIKAKSIIEEEVDNE